MAFTYNRYLFQCDSLYKKGSNDKTLFKNLIIKLPLSKFIKDLNNFSLSSSINNLQEKAFLLFYLNYFVRPSIDIVKRVSTTENNFVLTFSLSKLKAEKFLFTFLNEFYCPFFEELFYKNNCKKFSTTKSLLLKCNHMNSYGFRFYLLDLLDTTNVKKLSFFTYFVYNN